MKNKEVVEAFLSGDVATGSNLCSTGYKLFSYRTCIAEWHGGYLIVNTTRYSNTTSRHQSYFKHISNIIRVDNVPINTQELHSFLEGETMNATDLAAIENKAELSRNLKKGPVVGY